MFLGWIIVCLLDECIAISLGELAARWPTSAGPYYWSFQIASPRYRTVLSFITGWTWLVGNWTITLSVNFGFASLLAGGVSIFLPEYVWQPWKLVLIFYGLCVVTFFIVAFGNKFLPTVDTFCAAFTAITIFIVCVCLSSEAKDGRHSASYTLVSTGVADGFTVVNQSREISTQICPAGETLVSGSELCLRLIREWPQPHM
jgi:amino acid transporter